MNNISFSFGSNWLEFHRFIDENRINDAELSIKDFMGIESLKGKTFLDIGCGSGLFSLAAFRLGASNVVSFDLDQFSVESTKRIHNMIRKPKNWVVTEGSILDKEFIKSLSKFDVVYSWGVLHHTGRMWEAIRNSAKFVEKGGMFYIAIYNKKQGLLGSNTWKRIKILYNNSRKPIKFLLEFVCASRYHILPNLIRMRNPLRSKESGKRGMRWWTDTKDWLGGYPYEFATVEEIVNFMNKNFKNFKLLKLKKASGLENNWFLFKRIK